MNKSHTNWKKLKIEDCAEVIGGGTPSTKKKEYWDGDISWITPKDLSNYNNRYISKGSRNISEKGLKYSSARLLPKNSVLLTTRAPIGYLAISKKELATNQGFKSLIMKNGNFPEFFYYLLKNNISKLLQYASGTTFMELNATNLKSIEFYIPEVKEQKRIASILSAHLAIMSAGIFFHIGLSIFAYSSNKATADIPLFAPFLYTITLEALGFFFSSHTSFQTPSSTHQKVSTPSNSPVLCAIIR